MSVQRGLDPRTFTLVAFGGAGGMHACALADDLGIRRVLVPAACGVLSALGLAVGDLRRDYSRALFAEIGDGLGRVHRGAVPGGPTEPVQTRMWTPGSNPPSPTWSARPDTTARRRLSAPRRLPVPGPVLRAHGVSRRRTGTGATLADALRRGSRRARATLRLPDRGASRSRSSRCA